MTRRSPSTGTSGHRRKLNDGPRPGDQAKRSDTLGSPLIRLIDYKTTRTISALSARTVVPVVNSYSPLVILPVPGPLPQPPEPPESLKAPVVVPKPVRH